MAGWRKAVLEAIRSRLLPRCRRTVMKGPRRAPFSSSRSILRSTMSPGSAPRPSFCASSSASASAQSTSPGVRLLVQEWSNGLDRDIGKFLVHSELAAGKPNAADVRQRRERLHFGARARGRLAAKDQQDRNCGPPCEIDELIAAVERIKSPGDKPHRRK